MELYVFDLELNLLGEISESKELIIERNYTKISKLVLRVASSQEMLELLQHDNILTTKTNTTYGYIIENFLYTDEAETEIEVHAYSLNWMLSWRTIERQQRYNGNLEDVVKAFVNSNCINPVNPNRIIPNLEVAPNTGINIITESTKTGTTVIDHAFELCNANEVSIDVLINHETKKFEVVTWQGMDRSTLQDTNPHVIFSKEFDNIINQKYVNSRTNYKTTAVVAGEGEGVNRQVAVINDNLSGFSRREAYIDARDIQSTYTDDNDNDIILTPSQYAGLLTKRGNEQLSNFEIIETFESEVDMYSQFIYGTDYGLGDKVSVRNDEIKKVLHTRVISATLTTNNEGTQLKINFGSTIPDPLDAIARKVRKWQ